MDPELEKTIEKLRGRYRSICGIMELLTEHGRLTNPFAKDSKKAFQLDCTYLLSNLAWQDETLSDREKVFIRKILGIDLSEDTARTFSHANTKFSMETVCQTMIILSEVPAELWKKLGTESADFAATVIDFLENLGESFLKNENPEAELSRLYHFTSLQRDYVKNYKPDIPTSADRYFSSIRRDFFGEPVPVKEKATAGNQDEKNENYTVTQEVMEDPMGELQALIGLEDIKKDVKELINLVKIQKLRKERGMKSVPVSLHLVFTGNPGTGKTTVARILAQLYRQIGVLEGGQLVETDRSGLVAGYVGQTAIKTQEMIKQAMGGVLFIDEAYSLAKDGNDFGQEAIATILKAMEDNRDKFVVIVAGYDELMETFINSNPGLRSRFNKYFHFPDYSAEEMMGIFRLNCKKYQYVLSEEAEKIAEDFLTQLEEEKDDNFANARDVRNYFEKVVTRQASRVAELAEPNDEDIQTLIAEDMRIEDEEEAETEEESEIREDLEENAEENSEQA